MVPCEEEIQIHGMAWQFTQERLKLFAVDWDCEHCSSVEMIREMADLDFSGMLVSKE